MDADRRQRSDSSTALADRRAGGRSLADHLTQYKGKATLVLGIPRGGVPVAEEGARALGAEFDIIVARKVSVPDEPEFALGAVTANGGQYLNEAPIAALDVIQ